MGLGKSATLSHSIVIGAGPSPEQPASSLATSTSTANAGDPALSLTLAPDSASVMQSGTVSFGIEAGNGPVKLGSARLSVDGLPSA